MTSKITCPRKRTVHLFAIASLMFLVWNLSAMPGIASSRQNWDKTRLLADKGNQNNLIFGGPGLDQQSSPTKQPPLTQNVGPAEQPTEAPPVDTFSQNKTDQSPPRDTGGARRIPGTGEIELNFDNAEIDEVVRTLAEILNINYILDPNVKGQATIQTAGSLKKEELFPVFLQILQVNGLTAIKEGNLFKIVPIKDAARQPIAKTGVGRGRSAGQTGSFDAQTIVQIIPLEYIDPDEMAKILAPFVSAQGTIVSHNDAQTLIVVDTLSNIRKILNLVSAFDINFFERIHYRFYPLEYANAGEVAQALQSFVGSMGEKIKNEVAFIPIERLNTLLAVGPNPQAFGKIKNIVKALDAAPADTEPKIHIYFVKNGQAGELAELLNQVFSGTSASETKKTSEATQPKNPYAIPSKGEESQAPRQGQVESKSLAAEASAALGDNVQITPDEIRNALVIESTPRDYRVIENILNRLDVLPRQVLIEVMIAEISLNTSLELGVDWEYVKGGGDISTSLLSANIGSAGLQYVIGQANRWSSALSALAKKDKVNILSSPTVLASDNKEAKIDISTEVPVASAQYQYTGETEPLLQTNIQYRNTGVILTVTPHINEYGLVSMDINQEVSEQSENVQVGNESLPSFFKRSVDTSLTVRHGQTIVIGGLIRENRSEGRSGVPCLGGVPVFDWIFGKKSNTRDKTELIILITPRVIANFDDVDAVTREFKNKVGHVIYKTD